MAKTIMPLNIYNFDCPYCGGIDTISFIDNKGNFTLKDSSKSMIGAACMRCKKEFAVLWDLLSDDPTPHHRFSDLDAFIDSFINEYEDMEKRDIDSFLIEDD